MLYIDINTKLLSLVLFLLMGLFSGCSHLKTTDSITVLKNYLWYEPKKDEIFKKIQAQWEADSEISEQNLQHILQWYTQKKDWNGLLIVTSLAKEKLTTHPVIEDYRIKSLYHLTERLLHNKELTKKQKTERKRWMMKIWDSYKTCPVIQKPIPSKSKGENLYEKYLKYKAQ